jgi:dipeptidase E
MTARSLLLISNSAQFGKGYLEHCEDEILNILEGKDNIVFIPYALADHDGYTKIAEKRFAELGKKVTGIHKALNKNELLGKSDAVFIGGGNTFRLLTELYKHDLLDTIRSQVLAGELVYMGASAGSNVATP